MPPISMEKPDHMPPIPNIVDLEDDRLLSSFVTPIFCRGSSKINAISVEQYTHARDLHLSIMASLRRPTPPPPPPPPVIIHLDDDDEDDDVVQVVQPPPPPPWKKRTRRSGSSYVVEEIGQSSKKTNNSRPLLKPFMCEICVEPKPLNEAFNIPGCAHFYCADCVVKYIASKLQDNITGIRCPVSNCRGLLEPEYCRGILPPDVFERWGNALCEAVLLASEKFYCPYKDCSALFLHYEGEGERGGDVITQSECPYCKRSFCLQCKTDWHSGMDCEEFQRMNQDEGEVGGIMMMKLAKKKKWKRCPNCKFYVERNQGCNHMKCRSVCFLHSFITRTLYIVVNYYYTCQF